MNAIANAFKRAKGIPENKIEGSLTKMSTGHRKLLAEQVLAEKGSLTEFVDRQIAARTAAKDKKLGKK